jgi:tRNA nucleotidyltransferase (CCA-adding enzyme)
MDLLSWPSDKTQRSDQLEKILSCDQKYYLALLAAAAEKICYPLYIVGGFVRDILLGILPSDLDLVVEGDALILADKFTSLCGGEIVFHKKFKTASITVPSIEHPGRPVIFDLVSSRSEIYEKPGALPTVSLASIRDDLFRRDFTINSLAIRLDGVHRGEFRDEMNGVKDLQNGIVRITHEHSFREDPTRILRAARYIIRFDFKLSDDTLIELLSERDGVSHLSSQRIRHELDIILNDDKAGLMIMQLAEWKILERIHPKLNMDHSDLQRMDLLRGVSGNERIKYLWTLWLMVLPVDTLEQVDKRLHFPGSLRKTIMEASCIYHSIESYGGIRPSDLVKKLSRFSLLSIQTVKLVLPSGRIKENINKYLETWRYVRPKTTGENLIKIGIPPGPLYRRILGKLRDALLDGEISTVEEENSLVKTLISEAGE